MKRIELQPLENELNSFTTSQQAGLAIKEYKKRLGLRYIFGGGSKEVRGRIDSIEYHRDLLKVMELEAKPVLSKGERKLIKDMIIFRKLIHIHWQHYSQLSLHNLSKSVMVHTGE